MLKTLRKKLKNESRARAKVGASQETVRMKCPRQIDTVGPYYLQSTGLALRLFSQHLVAHDSCGGVFLLTKGVKIKIAQGPSVPKGEGPAMTAN